MGGGISKKVHAEEIEKREAKIRALEADKKKSEAKLNKEILQKQNSISELNGNVARISAKLRIADRNVEKTGIRRKEAETFEKKVKAVFNAYDDDRDGFLSFEEIADIYRDKAMEIGSDFFPHVLATVSPGFDSAMLTKWYVGQEQNLNDDYESIFPQETFVARLLALMGRFDTDADCYLGQSEMTSLIQITRPLSLTASLKMSALKKSASTSGSPPAEDESKTENSAKAEDESKTENSAKAEDESKTENSATAEDESKTENSAKAADESPAEAITTQSESKSRWEKLCKMCKADPIKGFDFMALARRYSTFKKTLSLDLEEDYQTVFFSAYKDACDVVSKGDDELKKVNSNLEKKKDKLAKQQKQQKDAMNDTTSAVAKAAAIFGMFRESEEDGDAFLNFTEYSQFHRGVAEIKKDGEGKGGDDVVLSKEAWTKLVSSIPECDPEVGLSLDAFIQLKTIQQNMDLNKSYDAFFFAKYNELSEVYKAKEAVAVETATIAANKTKANNDRVQTLTDQKEKKQLDKSDQMAATLFGKFHDFKDLTDYRLSASQLAAILSAALGEEQTIGDAKWALYCSEVKADELPPEEGAAPDAPKKYKGMTLAQFVAWCDSASASAAGLNRRKAIRKIFYTQADAALANAEDKSDILKPLIPAAKAARIDADTKRERREELAKGLATVTEEMNTQQQKREKLGELLERHSSATAAATATLAQELFELLKSGNDIRGENLQELFKCANNSAAIKRVEELAALRGLSKEHFVGSLAKGLIGSGNTALNYYTMYGASNNAQKVEAIFVQMDKDKDGKLSLTELSDLLKDTVGGDVEASAQEILKKLHASDVTLQQLGQLYESGATDESARTWLRSVDGDYAKMPYSPKFSTTGSHGDAASMSEAMFTTCDKDGDGYLQSDELLVFLQACEKGSPTVDAATRRIHELHTAVGPGVTGLEISLLKSMFAEPKRFNLPSRYHATTFDNLAVAPAQKNLERLQKLMAEAKQALTEADDVANPAESEAKRKEDERDEATQIFEKADAEAKRQVELADNAVQECIVRIYGALAEKARQEMEVAQAKAASCRAVADAANETAETERKAGEAKAASCKNKAWDASVNWLDMKIKKTEEQKASLEATLKTDNKKKEKQLEKARAESLRCRRLAEQHMVLAHKKEYTEKKRIADEAVTTQRKITSDTLEDVEKQIKKQLKRRSKAEKQLVKANAHARNMHLMSTHADLIPRVRLIHDHFDKDKDGHIMDEEFFKFIRSLGRDVGAKPSKAPKRQKSRSNQVAPAPEPVSISDAQLREIYETSMMKCSNGITLEMMVKLYRNGVMKHDIDTDYQHLFG